nr:reverse transcriptase domain-containing protein [Tanacetum cinerariifolium]
MDVEAESGVSISRGIREKKPEEEPKTSWWNEDLVSDDEVDEFIFPEGDKFGAIFDIRLKGRVRKQVLFFVFIRYACLSYVVVLLGSALCVVFLSNPSSNPTPSTNPNPKGRNRRRSKQRIEEFSLDELSPPIGTMADQRTMAQLLQAPTEGYEDAIVVLAITADNFELKHGLLTLRFDESFSESWDRFKDPFRACPHHGFSKLHQLDTFYNALNSKDQDSLNSAVGGNFLDKMPRECLAIIESKSKFRYSCNKPVVAKVSTNTSTSGISPDVAELKDMVKALLLDKKSQNQAPATVKAVKKSCVTCSGAHSYRNYPATDGNVYRDNIQEFVSQASAINYNQGYTRYRPLMIASTSSSGTLPSNTIANPRSDLKAITTRRGLSYDGPQIPPPPSFRPKVVENELEATKDTVHPTNNGSTKDVQPQVVQSKSSILTFEPVTSPISEPVSALLSLPDLSPTCMTLEITDRSISRPVRVPEDVYVKVEYSHEVLCFSDVIASCNPTSYYDPIISTTSSTLTPFENSDFLLEEVDAFLALEDDPTSSKVDQSYIDSEGDILLLEAFLNDDPSLPPPNQENYLPEVRKELKSCEAKSDKFSIDEPPEVELKDLPPHIEYTFLEGDDKLLVIIAKDLSVKEKDALRTVLKSHKRVCIDYRKLNEATCKDHFPLSFMDQMLERLAGNQYYCFLDGLSGYFQIPIDPKDQEKTTFTCPYETFAYRHMPFGLCNAPCMFQRCMMAIFHDMIEKTMDVFMDDFLVFGKDIEELTKAPILIAPDWDMPFELMCDASDFAIGAVLGQRQDKHFRPTHNASKTMNEAESNYTTTENEMLAVVYAFEKFRSYLIMNKSIVYMDHSPLNIYLPKKIPRRDCFDGFYSSKNLPLK